MLVPLSLPESIKGHGMSSTVCTSVCMDSLQLQLLLLPVKARLAHTPKHAKDLQH